MNYHLCQVRLVGLYGHWVYTQAANMPDDLMAELKIYQRRNSTSPAGQRISFVIVNRLAMGLTRDLDQSLEILCSNWESFWNQANMTIEVD